MSFSNAGLVGTVIGKVTKGRLKIFSVAHEIIIDEIISAGLYRNDPFSPRKLLQPYYNPNIHYSSVGFTSYL